MGQAHISVLFIKNINYYCKAYKVETLASYRIKKDTLNAIILIDKKNGTSLNMC